MSFRRLIDWLQLRFFLLGFTKAANFIGRWGTPVMLYGRVARIIEHDSEVIAGPGWSLEKYAPTAKLTAIVFDPTFRANEGINLETDIALPLSHLDVN